MNKLCEYCPLDIETQGAFAERFAAAMRPRLGMACTVEFGKQSDFSEPLMRVNVDSADRYVAAWETRRRKGIGTNVILREQCRKSRVERIDCLVSAALSGSRSRALARLRREVIVVKSEGVPGSARATAR